LENFEIGLINLIFDFFYENQINFLYVSLFIALHFVIIFKNENDKNKNS
jgi:hypothetical protein